MKEDNISQLGDYDVPFCEQQYKIANPVNSLLDVFLCFHFVSNVELSGSKCLWGNAKMVQISVVSSYPGFELSTSNCVENSMGLVISLCSNSNHLISLIPPPPPKLPQILDIYSVVAL